MSRTYKAFTDSERKRAALQRMLIVHGFLLLCLIVIVTRLVELQIVQGAAYRALAQKQHFGGVVLPAKRGTIFALDSKTGELSILATNTTLDLVYVDPLITDDPHLVAAKLTDILVTKQFHDLCTAGDQNCPLELTDYYAAAFDPIERMKRIGSGILLEPLAKAAIPPVRLEDLPSFDAVKQRFTADIEKKIGQKRVTFAPLLYGADKVQLEDASKLAIPGVYVEKDSKLIYADPEEISQFNVPSTARRLSQVLHIDESATADLLRSRPLRYVAVMRKLSPDLSAAIKEMKLKSQDATNALKRQAANHEAAQKIFDPLRSIALISEHWRYYPDGQVASHVVGFLNPNQEAQYGIERTFDAQLRGQEGRISAVSDQQGGQILTNDQTIVNPRDGDSLVLTIDRFIQKKTEEVMQEAVRRFHADSGQAIVMDPKTGRILAMVNIPLFDSNNYGAVYEKEPVHLDDGQRKNLVVEIYDPVTNEFVVKAYLDDIFTPEGRLALTEKTQARLIQIEKLRNLRDIARYYMYVGVDDRYEVFPTERPDTWLTFKNHLGVGAYINRNVQEIYEPGSVFKPVTMAIAIDQGEVNPDDTYLDTGVVKVAKDKTNFYTIRNAFNATYGKVTMRNCLEFSINTCMTSVSQKLGKKLFPRMIERFGFGKITGVELEDELPGAILPWKDWTDALVATAAFGQGISMTPLQMITAMSSLANNGKLMRPTIIDSVIHIDGTVEKTKPVIVDQVLKPETTDTVTSMMVGVVQRGFGKSAAIPGYLIAGKTGTSQIAGPGGKYSSGTGTTITSFGGFAPAFDPKFAIFVKFDRPKARDLEYGSQTGAPVFRMIAKFLFDYYGIPPDAEVKKQQQQ